MPRPARPVLAFFLLTYALSWLCFVAAAAVAGAVQTPLPVIPELVTPLGLLGTFGPALAAIALTAGAEGSDGLAALLGRMFATRAAVRWYVFAAGYMAAIRLTVAVAYRLITGAWPIFGADAWYVIAAAIAASTPIQAGEEIGWRGYALPRLEARLGLARASLLLGLVWAVWHLPLFFLPGNHNYGQSFPVYALSVVALSVALAWLYANTDGSLLLVMLMHSAVNQSVDIVPATASTPGNPFGLSASLVQWLSLACLWATAAYFLLRMRRPARASSS